MRGYMGGTKDAKNERENSATKVTGNIIDGTQDVVIEKKQA